MIAHDSDWDELQAIPITLPGGYWDAEGNLHREAVIRPIIGREEEFVAERIGSFPIPMLVTRLISRCVLGLGSFAPLTPNLARNLLVADRDYLLLMLRQLTFDKHIQAVLDCPACHEKMDLDFDIDQVFVEQRIPPVLGTTMELSPATTYRDQQGKEQRHVEFRLPTGGDQEMIARLGLVDKDRAADLLFERCVTRLGDAEQVDRAAISALNPLARVEIESRMEQVSPLVDLEMDIHCPQCGHVFVQYFDFAAFFLMEIRQRRGQLYREVHYLALHYHWPESEILALTRTKRRAYLDLLYQSQSTGMSTRN
jgi:hypothetical protein